MITLDQLGDITYRCAHQTKRYCTSDVRCHEHLVGSIYNTYIEELDDDKDFDSHQEFKTKEEAYNRFAEFLGEPLVSTEETFESIMKDVKDLDERLGKAKKRLVDFSTKDALESFDDDPMFDDDITF